MLQRTVQCTIRLCASHRKIIEFRDSISEWPSLLRNRGAMALHSRCKKAATEPQVHWAMFGAKTKHDPWSVRGCPAAHSTVEKQAPWGRLDYIRNLKTIKSVIFETTQDCKCNFRSVSVIPKRGTSKHTARGGEIQISFTHPGNWSSNFLLHSWYWFQTIKACKCKCNQDGNSCRNNLRVHVNLVHLTLGGA